MNVAAQERFTQEQREAQEQAQKDDKKRQKNASNSAKPPDCNFIQAPFTKSVRAMRIKR